MSAWTHSICVPCWNKRHPDREPTRMIEEFRVIESCCFCGELHASGIYVREDPTTLRCRGKHEGGT